MSLKHRLAAEIHDTGPMTVARFMERALYEPRDGYYSQQDARAGVEWFTAPTFHALFGLTLSRGISPLLAQLDDPLLLDVGSGGGQLARDILFGIARFDRPTFDRLDILIADRSEASLERSLKTLGSSGIDLADVTASTEIPDHYTGVLVGNELLDAIPVNLCEATEHGPVEMLVTHEDGRFQLVPGQIGEPEVEALAEYLWERVTPGTRFEVPALGLEWYGAAAQEMDQGALIIIDYGGTFEEITKEHHRGSIHGYHEGLRVREYLANPGRQDITYLVPFDLFREVGERAGLTTQVYAPQGEVLKSLGIHELATQLTQLDELAVNKLVDKRGAGGTFKVLVQTRDIELRGDWPRFKDENA